MKDIKEIARQALEPDEYIDSFSREDLIKEIRRLEDECERLRGERDKFITVFVEAYADGGEFCADCSHSKLSGSGWWGHTCEVDECIRCPAVEQLQETDNQLETIKCNGLNCRAQFVVQHNRTVIEDYGWMTDPDDSQIYYCSSCKEGVDRIKGVDGV